MKLGRHPKCAIKNRIKANSTPYILNRPTTEKGDRGQTTHEVEEVGEVNLWLFQPESSHTYQQGGMRTTQTLSGRCLPKDAEKLETGDFVEHHGIDFQVSSLDARPNDNNTEYFTINLEEVVVDG